MEKKKKRWPFALVVAVLGLTVYNILPTIFFYTKPLNAPIQKEAALEVGAEALKRVNALEQDSLSWVKSYANLLNVKLDSAKIQKKHPEILEATFATEKDATIFKKYLPRAGSLIPFFPAQLSLSDETNPAKAQSGTEHTVERAQNVVYIQRRIPLRFDTPSTTDAFSFAQMFTDEGAPTAEYTHIIEDRVMALLHSLMGTTENATLVSLVLENPGHPQTEEFVYQIAQNINLLSRTFASEPTIAKNFYATLTMGPNLQKDGVIDSLISALGASKDRVQSAKISAQEAMDKEEESDASLYEALSLKEENLLKAITTLKKNKIAAASGSAPLGFIELQHLIKATKETPGATTYALQLSGNPLLESLTVDYPANQISLTLKPAIANLFEKWETQKEAKAKIDQLNQILYDEVARVSREADEVFTPKTGQFTLKMSDIDNAKTFITFNLSAIAKSQVSNIKKALAENWKPSSADLSRENYPTVDWTQFEKLPKSQKNLKLVIYSPNLMSKYPMAGFKNNSIYVIAKDLNKIIQKQQMSGSNQTSTLGQDLQELQALMRNNGFMGYPGSTFPFSSEFADDYIFEAPDFYLPVLQATRENFSIHGTKKFAVLEFSNLKNRIITTNRIETAMHEDLLKWRDEYNAAQVDPTLHSKFDVPAPTKNILLNNWALSFKKYFRGDERKILHWGLDLDGGKTVQVALKDNKGQFVTSESDLKQGINELYNRVNKMGVSDVNIRQEGSYITLDFPGSQNLSAAELIKASSMTFHLVNENFTPDNASYGNDVNKFLQEVWNEAVVTNKKDTDSINAIAYNHLYGNVIDTESAMPRSEAGKVLYAAGLRLQDPNMPEMDVTFNTELSKIGILRGDSFANWQGQSHPLMVLFNNYALEGSSLENVHSGYDPTQGNYLSFDISSSNVKGEGEKYSPRNALFNWTNTFSKETIQGTPYESVTKGRGWRMAVVLNGNIISAPALAGPLKTQGQITGHFTQREINRLVSDLKAGSLSFTPQIVSETSVSPELGKMERAQGIVAAILALAAVIVIMIGYYRFAGLVASVAVLLNLLIMWATLQNIGASITLPMIAGIILTIGMAVDANVLVFERMREELAQHGKLLQSVSTGYQKAFTAIIDSNVTTIIAALILLHFDSGPIKGFAVTLIIGIVSSMFTALFMTKLFFTRWARNPKHKTLSMANLIKKGHFNFLRYGKAALIGSLVVIVAGFFSLSTHKNTIFGMDFTGGFAVNLEVEGLKPGMEREAVQKALVKAGLTQQEIQVRELSDSSKLRLFLSKSIELPGKPFYNLPAEEIVDDMTYSYEAVPRLTWLVKSLEKGGVKLSEKTLFSIDQNFKSISGQMSDVMRNNAIIGLSIALAAILLYITLRFEFTFALSSTLGLAFDVLLTLSILAFLHLMGVAIQIDLNTVAALMTIVGYSLNDTIIVFDRIREDVKMMRRNSFREVINHSLNITLSRTVMTSVTTLIVLVCLVAFGGSSIFGFSLVMAIGVVVGTLSTFFIATTLLFLFHKRSKNEKQEKLQLNGT